MPGKTKSSGIAQYDKVTLMHDHTNKRETNTKKSYHPSASDSINLANGFANSIYYSVSSPSRIFISRNKEEKNPILDESFSFLG